MILYYPALKCKAGKEKFEEIEKKIKDKYEAEFAEREPSPREAAIIKEFANDLYIKDLNPDRDVMCDHMASLDLPMHLIRKYYLKSTKFRTVGDLYSGIIGGAECIVFEDLEMILKSLHDYFMQEKKYVPSALKVSTNLGINTIGYIDIGQNDYYQVSIRGKEISQFIISDTQLEKMVCMARQINSDLYYKYIDVTFTFPSGEDQGYKLNIYCSGPSLESGRYAKFHVTIYDMATNEAYYQKRLHKIEVNKILWLGLICKYLKMPDFTNLKG